MKKVFCLVLLFLAAIGCGISSIVFFFPFFQEGINAYDLIDQYMDIPFWIYWIIGLVFGYVSYELFKLFLDIIND